MELKNHNKERIADILLECKAITINVSNPFTFTSGIKSPIYCDNRVVLGYPDKWRAILNSYISLLSNIKFDFIAGVATAGIPHASALAYILEKPLVYVRDKRKLHGKMNVIEGRAEKSSKGVVIEDHITTGGSSLSAVKSLLEEGYKVSACISITTYKIGEKAFKEYCPVFSLTDLDTILERALLKGIITERDKEEVLRWRSNPKEWP